MLTFCNDVLQFTQQYRSLIDFGQNINHFICVHCTLFCLGYMSIIKWFGCYTLILITKTIVYKILCFCSLTRQNLLSISNLSFNKINIFHLFIFIMLGVHFDSIKQRLHLKVNILEIQTFFFKFNNQFFVHF